MCIRDRYPAQCLTVAASMFLENDAARAKKVLAEAKPYFKSKDCLLYTSVVEKVGDLMEIVKLGVMAAPSLMIDGKLAIAGRTAKTSEIVRLLKK